MYLIQCLIKSLNGKYSRNFVIRTDLQHHKKNPHLQKITYLV
jgi:hypothetical protein